jgi:hypothetical protein
MRKTIISENQHVVSPALSAEHSLDLDALAQVWVTSEASNYPIESALLQDLESEWRAGLPGEQIIRLIFDQPVTIKRIRLVFNKQDYSHTQEFVLRWSMDNDTVHEILRQQYHFSPPDTTSEIEDYAVNLPQLKLFELVINPDISNDKAFANLKQLRLWKAED